MRSARAVRRSTGRPRARAQGALGSVSRLTVRSPGTAPRVGPRVGHAVRLGEALRASREALGDIQRQLDVLLAAVRAPAGRPVPDAADHLARAARRAGVAMDRLAGV